MWRPGSGRNNEGRKTTGNRIPMNTTTTRRIGYVLGQFPSVSETFIQREIAALAENGFEVDVFPVFPRQAEADLAEHTTALSTPPWICRRPRWHDLGAWHRLIGHAIRNPRGAWHALRGCPPMPLKSLHSFLRALRNMLIAANIVTCARARGITHLHAHFAFMPTDIARMAGILCGCAWSVSVHAKDIYTQSSTVLANRLHGASFVAACTDHGRQTVSTTVGDLVNGPCLVARHGVDTSWFTPETRHVQGADNEVPVIVGIGRLEEKKGFRFLVLACRELVKRGFPFRCIIAGDGDLKYALQQLIQDCELGGRVELRGIVNREEVRRLCRSATVSVLPSIVAHNGDRDGLPNVILEAMACGCPVISTTASAANEAVEDEVHGFLVAPADRDALAQRMADLLQLPESRRTDMGHAARARVCRDFDARQTIQPLLEAFRTYA